MKYRLLIITFILMGNISLYSQIPEWEWAINAGGTSNDEVYNIDTDTEGNVYMIGIGSSPFIYDTIIFNLGYFIAKCSSSGQVLWAKNTILQPQSFILNSNNNIYIGGTNFSDTAVVFINDTLTGPCIYLSKYDVNGNLIWIKNAGTFDCDNCGCGIMKITIDNTGNLYIIGEMSDINTFTIGNTVMTSWNQDYDIFIAKYDSSGNPLWAKSFGGHMEEDGYGITADMNGNVYITGSFASSIISFDSTILTNLHSGKSDMFIAKFNTSGDLLWAKSAGGNDFDIASCIVVDSSSNVYISGSFWSPFIVFDSDTLMNSNTYGNNYFITKYNSQGNILWIKSAVGRGSGINMLTDTLCNVYIIGSFSSPQFVFNGTTILNSVISGSCFVVKYDSSGNVKWAVNIEGGNGGRDIATDIIGEIYVSGVYTSDSIIIGNDTLTNLSEMDFADIFLAKLHDSNLNIEAPGSNSFIVYPNPTTGKLIISDLPASGQIQIINSTGQTIKTARFRDQANINFTLAESGIYIIRVMTDKGAVTKKVVVCRSE
jgi:hypothetical protein